ncbi:MAG TPA: AMP-binding protein [Steroidobacteraceae bacterium]|nr:AMP-binding protein [Steroidobacteraceae bacterium]
MPKDDCHSLVRGRTSPPLLEYPIHVALLEAVRLWPGDAALVSRHQSIRWTWSELGQRVDALAAGFLEMGLGKGDRVGIWAPNCAEWVLTQFATARIGAILTTINPAYRISEAEYTFNKVGIKALICAESFKSSRYIDMVEEMAPELRSSKPGALQAARIPSLRHLISLGPSARPGWLSFASASRDVGERDRSELERVGSALSNRDPVSIQFTSGTTGLPKGATLSHRNILNNGYFVGRTMGLQRGDRLCIPVPLYHCFGMVMGNLACLTHGATMVFPSAGFEAAAVLEAVEQERCTALYGVPTMFIAALQHPDFDRFDLSSLRTGIMAGSPCPIEVMRQVIDRMHMTDVTIAYGMTETSPVSMQSSINDPMERRVSTIGEVQPHLEVKVVDPATGATVARGQAGELCTRGYSVMLGYWDDAEKTAEAIDKEGWMHSGDIAIIDAEGYGNIVGRIKDMVIRGGENIYPREIEEYLFRHPKVEAAQVVGVPDPTYGEELCAWIKLRSGESATAEEIASFCRGQIAHYKIPRYIRFVDSFPMTVTGKIQKYQIREVMMRELGLTTAATA